MAVMTERSPIPTLSEPHPVVADGDNSPHNDTNILLISLKRPRNFYERAAKELFASGVDTVKISALGEAISTAVELASLLEDKKAACIEKIETKCQPTQFTRPGAQQATAERNETDGETETREYEAEPVRTPGVYIVLRKHPEFKGSRIAPGHVSWCAQPKDVPNTPAFVEAGPADTFASVVAGNATLGFQGEGQLRAVADLLKSESSGSHDLSVYQKGHTMALEAAWKAYKQHMAEQATGPFRLTEVTAEEIGSTDLKAVYCRPAINMHELAGDDIPKDKTGAVFIDVFDNHKAPYNQAKNSALIYVVTPSRNHYPSRELFLKAVRDTAANLMTALCDYNGMVRRQEKSTGGMKRLVTVRVCLFSSGANKAHDVTKLDIGKEILAGLDAEFRYRASPRLNLAYDDNIFKQAWIEQTGLEVPATKDVNDVSPVSTA